MREKRFEVTRLEALLITCETRSGKIHTPKIFDNKNSSVGAAAAKIPDTPNSIPELTVYRQQST